MYSFNTSEAEIIAIGNVLRVDIVMLTHKIQGRERTFEERTEWKRFGFNPDLVQDSVFDILSTGETLKLLHEDEVHYTKLVWMPSKEEWNPYGASSDSISNEGSLTRQRSNEKSSDCLKVTYPVESSIIVDQILNKRR